MLTFHLDKYQQTVEAALKLSDAVVVAGQKMSGKSFLLSEICRKAVLQHKSVLLVVPDEKQAGIYQKKLYRFHLQDYVLVFGNDQLLPEQKYKFFARIKSKAAQWDSKDHQMKAFRSVQLSNRINRYYTTLNKLLIFEKVWHELIVLNAFDRHATETLHFNSLFKMKDISFSQKEFDRMAEVIIRARQFYDLSEANIDRFFRKEIFTSDSAMQAWSIVMEWVSETRKSCINKLISIGLYIRERINAQMGSALLKGSKALEDFDALNARIFMAASQEKMVQPKRGFFQRETEPIDTALEEVSILIPDFMQLVKQFQSIQGFEAYSELKQINWTSLDDMAALQEKMEHLSGFLDHFQMYIHEAVIKEVGKLNIHATDDPTLSMLSGELEDFYKKIEDQNILNKTLEIAAFNIDKHIMQLDAVLKLVNEVAERADQFVKCYGFNKFYQALSAIDQQMIQNLIDLSPKDWTVFFRNWFVQNTIEQNGYFLQPVTETEILEFTALENELIRLDHLKYNSLAGKTTSELIQSLEKRNKRLFQNIFNKYQMEPDDWKTLTDSNMDLIRSLFPVCIVPFNNFNEMSSVQKEGYDHIILDLDDHYDENVLHSIEKLAKLNTKKIIAIDESAAKAEVLAKLFISKTEVCKLPGYHQQSLMPLVEMNHTERLYAARNLAHLLQDAAPGIEIFKMGNFLLYSCLSNPLNKLLLALLDKRGIKKMRVLETPFNLLLESLLDIKSIQVLITQDYLLDNTVSANISWQMYIKEQAAKAGIKTVNLNTEVIRNAPVKTISEFIEWNFPESSGGQSQ